MSKSTRYDVFADGVLDSTHAGLVGSCTTARMEAIGRDGVRFTVERHDSASGLREDIARYQRVGATLKAWVA